jgi:manganese-dependent inorganic pyrophosphatase
MKTYIIGHKKPDTDAVVSAMALQYLYENKNCFCHENPQAVITEDLNPETTFLFEKFEVETPKVLSATDITTEDKVILVDHNETSQRLDNLDPNQITEIVDHHKVNLNLGHPIFMTFKAWGSSCTIAYFMMKQSQVVPDKKLAAIMLAAILSDTVGYKSATTTKKDKEVGAELAEIAEIGDIDAFTLEIFKAKSDISTLTDEQIVKNDYKIFEFGQKTMIDQLETVEQDLVLSEKKAGLLEAMANIKTELGVKLLFVAVTDILKVNTKLLILSDSEKEVAQKAFGGTVVDSILDIGPKMSRKKEIAPAIEDALK